MTHARFACWIDSRVLGTGGEIEHLVLAESLLVCGALARAG
jgi:hypothetical protein